MAYVAANEQDLAARFGGEHGSCAFLPFEQTPVIDFGDGTVVVLDDDYLVDRVTKGLYWAVHDSQKAQSEQARQTWSIGYSQLIESTIVHQLQRITAPVPVVGGRDAQQTYLAEDEIRAAFIPKGRAVRDGSTATPRSALPTAGSPSRS